MKTTLYGIEPSTFNFTQNTTELAWMLVFPDNAAAVAFFEDTVVPIPASMKEPKAMRLLLKSAIHEQEVTLDYPDAAQVIEWVQAYQKIHSILEATLEQVLPVRT